MGMPEFVYEEYEAQYTEGHCETATVFSSPQQCQTRSSWDSDNCQHDISSIFRKNTLSGLG